MIDFAKIGYCTNVHAGADIEIAQSNLERYALAVKTRVSPNAPMGVGLWLSATAAERLFRERMVERFGGWLREVGLVPYTFNGFPQGDFHQPMVKHRVYEPTWWEKERLDYTLDLVTIQHALLPEGMSGSISTLPIAWGKPSPTHDQLMLAATNLVRVAERLARLEREAGRVICLCIEPEPGCVLQRSREVIRFFHDYLWRVGPSNLVRRYLKVCHDVCHAAVMFESQESVFRAFETASIGVGKVQVSSAVATPKLGSLSLEKKQAVFAQLGDFREERYLHQTVVCDDAAEETEFYQDLPEALQARNNPAGESGEWRVHFHVPIYLERFGNLQATQSEIRGCLTAARKRSDVEHFEVETYAWGVLPPELRQPNLAHGIADEMNWYIDLLKAQQEQTQAGDRRDQSG